MRPAAVFLGLMLTPALAVASPTFPAQVQATLDMPCKPICTTCHTRLEGGIGTARKPFGLAMQAAGLQAGAPNLVAGALQKLETDGSDVDKDGVPDIEELRNMDDPNTAKTSLECLNETAEDDSGCNVANGARTRTGPSSLWLALTVLVAARLAKRRMRYTR